MPVVIYVDFVTGKMPKPTDGKTCAEDYMNPEDLRVARGIVAWMETLKQGKRDLRKQLGSSYYMNKRYQLLQQALWKAEEHRDTFIKNCPDIPRIYLGRFFKVNPRHIIKLLGREYKGYGR